MNIKHLIFSFITVISTSFWTSSWGAAASPGSSQKASYDLIAAAEMNDIATIERAITEGASVNTTDQHGDTPLIWAAEKGHTQLAQRLIAARANVNQANKAGNTPLIRAARNGHTATVQA